MKNNEPVVVVVVVGRSPIIQRKINSLVNEGEVRISKKKEMNNIHLPAGPSFGVIYSGGGWAPCQTEDCLLSRGACIIYTSNAASQYYRPYPVHNKRGRERETPVFVFSFLGT